MLRKMEESLNVLIKFMKVYKSMIKMLGKKDDMYSNNKCLILKELVSENPNILVDMMQMIVSFRFKTWDSDEKCIVTMSKLYPQMVHIDNDINQLKISIYYICKTIIKIHNREMLDKRELLSTSTNFQEF